MAPEATGSTTPVSDRPSQPHSAAELTRRNVERVMALEAAEHEKASLADRIADAITAFSGSIRFVWINLALIGGWMVANRLLPPRDRLDPFPFPLLTLVLSVEAIFLAIFILMSQNRAAGISEKRGHLDLQLNLLSEQENTKMLQILERIAKKVGAHVGDDPQVRALEEATRPESLVEQIEEAFREERDRPPKSGKTEDS